MNWESWSAFWDMGGNAFYVWGSYGVTALLVIVELVQLRARSARLEVLLVVLHHGADHVRVGRELRGSERP